MRWVINLQGTPKMFSYDTPNEVYSLSQVAAKSVVGGVSFELYEAAGSSLPSHFSPKTRTQASAAGYKSSSTDLLWNRWEGLFCDMDVYLDSIHCFKCVLSGISKHNLVTK